MFRQLNLEIHKPKTTIILLMCLLTTTSLAAEPMEMTARRIMQSAGVRGGLVIHLGCGDGQLTAALRIDDRYLVQGLDRDARKIRQARNTIHAAGQYGPVSVACHRGPTLPYADNLVNLIIVSDPQWLKADELIRILAPNGIVMIQSQSPFQVSGHLASLRNLPCFLGNWTKLVKPWPTDIDEWTHYLHSANNNAVAQDTVVGPPRHYQWIGGPRFSRSHDHLASVSTAVTAGGRLFSIVDMGSIALVGARPRWQLVARDAFSGVLLWKRDIAKWEYHLRDFRSGPAELPRRLVAVGDHVYVTLGYGAPVTCLDAATGATIRTYTGTEDTQEILFSEDRLFLVLGDPDKNWPADKAQQIVRKSGYVPPFRRYTPPVHNKRLMAVDATNGHPLWKVTSEVVRDLLPSTLAVGKKHVYFQNTNAVVCVNAETGNENWQTARPSQRLRLGWSTPTLVVYDGVVYSADRKATDTKSDLLWMPSGGYHEYIRDKVEGELIAMDAATGKRLWSCPAYEGFNAPVDVLIADNLLWMGRYAWGQDPGFTEARDLKTGEVVRRRPSDQAFLGKIGHARCHRAKATSKYLVLGRRGVECVDLKTGDMVANRFVRGICQYGVLPANGLIYFPPHSCACSMDDLIKDGYLALAPAQKQEIPLAPASDTALEQGPAYGTIVARATAASSFSPHPSDAWPMYRHNPGRSAHTPAAIPADLKTAWTIPIGGKLTSPVIAENTLLVAQSDTHRIHALDASTGQRRWTFDADARIDSSPTIDQGRALFGSADGKVYCLRMQDGAVIWCFHAAPCVRNIVVYGQLESTWPVSGSVLVQDGAVYFAAGRSSYLDGGIFLYKLDVATGKVIKAVALEIEQARRDRNVVSGGHMPDVLSARGDSIFMRSARFDQNLKEQKENVDHLWSPVGFLDDTWWHRTYWQFGRSMGSGWGGWTKMGRKVPSGRLLVSDGQRIVGYGRNQYDIPGAHVGVDGEGAWGPVGKGLSRWTHYRLFTRSLSSSEAQATDKSRTIPILAQSMVWADDTVWLAGPEDPLQHVAQEPAEVDAMADALKATKGGQLLALSVADGKIKNTIPLESPPIFDGMAVAQGHLYVATKSGEVICMTAR